MTDRTTDAIVTEAGRALIDGMDESLFALGDWAERIAAIEAEAAQRALDDVRAKVEAHVAVHRGRVPCAWTTEDFLALLGEPGPGAITAASLGLAMDAVLPPLRGVHPACEHGPNDRRYLPIEDAPSDYAAAVLAALQDRGADRACEFCGGTLAAATPCGTLAAATPFGCGNKDCGRRRYERALAAIGDRGADREDVR